MIRSKVLVVRAAISARGFGFFSGATSRSLIIAAGPCGSFSNDSAKNGLHVLVSRANDARSVENRQFSGSRSER
jgi:hypothetical protein